MEYKIFISTKKFKNGNNILTSLSKGNKNIVYDRRRF